MNETFERLAFVVYEKMRAKDPEGEKYPWVPNGNSHKQNEAREYVRAVLEALREPTAPMKYAVCEAEEDSGLVFAAGEHIGWLDAWRVAIDAALKETP